MKFLGRRSGTFSPVSRSIGFSPRPASNTGCRNAISLRGKGCPTPKPPLESPHRNLTSPAGSLMTSANSRLTSAEIEKIIKQRVCEKAGAIKRAFQTFDSSKNLTVTQGEFRRVLEHQCLPLTTRQFRSLLAKVGTNPNGTINYTRFLEKFLASSHHLWHLEAPMTPQPAAGKLRGARPRTASAELNRTSCRRGEAKSSENISPSTNLDRFTLTKSPQDVGMETIEKNLQKKIATNLKNILRALQLFDYNRDGLIQRHELRRVLENYCFRFTDLQFNKFWVRYDPRNVGTVNYRDFLRDLGANVAVAAKRLQAAEDENAPWDAKTKRLVREKSVTELVLGDDQIREKQRTKQLEELPFSQVEKEFRTKIRQNYENIKRVLMAFDLAQDGFISIDNLKSVVHNFVLPVSENLFQQLMCRFAIRGNGRVSWEQFLQKFQDPQPVRNGQTIPIGNSHKVNPIREAMEVSTVSEIVEKLQKHVLENYSSLKQTFLKFDERRKGVILRQDLRRIVETFNMKLPEECMKELFIALDPSHTGFIDYHNFLRLFEPKERLSAHKWLSSSHKVNQNQPALIMAWKSVEDNMNQKITENWRQFAAEYVALEREGRGTITKSHLRRLIERYALPLSDEHFEKLWSDCDETSTGRIALAQFLQRLGIDVKPGDLEGTSTRIFNESVETEKERQHNQAEKMTEMVQIGRRKTKLSSPEEVVKILRERMAQHDTGVRQSFLRCTSGKKMITKKNLRNILHDMGFAMENSQFEELAETLGLSNGRCLDYADFVHKFETTARNSVEKSPRLGNNHTVNPTNVRYMSAQECYNLLLDRMRENFASVRSAFYKVDDDHDGVLTMGEFRRLLDSFMFIITDDTYNELLKMLGLMTRSRLSYQDFLRKFEIVDKEEGHPWLNSQHRWNDTRTADELAAEQIHKCLCLKTEQAWQDMAKAFQNFDVDKNGIIGKKDLRTILFRFNLPMSQAEFEKLWERYDTDKKGFISHQDFWKKMGMVMASGDNGPSRKIVEQNYQDVLSHHEHQQSKHEELSRNQMTYSQKLQAETVEKELKDRFREHYSSFDKAFRQLDKNKDGYVTLADLRRVLLQLNYFLDEEQFTALLKRLNLPATNARLSYFDFLKAIDDGRASKYGQRKSFRKEQVAWDRSLDYASVEKAMEKFKEILTHNIDAVRSAFRAFDERHTGLVKVGEFRRVLDAFCFKLNDAQFMAILVKCRITQPTTLTPNQMVNWIVFLQDFTLFNGSKSQLPTENMPPAPSPKELPIDEVEERLREVVAARFDAILRLFADYDYANINVVSKEDFREVLNQHFMRLSDQQFDQVWAKQSVNVYNNLEYREFLKRYSQTDVPQSEKHGVQEQTDEQTQISPRRRPASAITTRERPLDRSSAFNSTIMNRLNSARPASWKDADSVEEKLKPFVYRRWQELHRECRKFDPEMTGSIPADEFIGILDRFGLFLSLEDARQLMTRFDQGSNLGLFSYRAFLQHFILSLKSRDEGLSKRKKIHSAKLPVDTGRESESFIEAMMKVRESVLQSWKELRRAFRRLDAKAEGVVTPYQFRQVLQQFSINLSEEDFYHLVSFYDHSMRGHIFYNEFIRAFLQ